MKAAWIAFALGVGALLTTPLLAGSASADTASVVRLARFVVVDSGVSWRPDTGAKWAQAAINLSTSPRFCEAHSLSPNDSRIWRISSRAGTEADGLVAS